MKTENESKGSEFVEEEGVVSQEGLLESSDWFPELSDGVLAFSEGGGAPVAGTPVSTVADVVLMSSKRNGDDLVLELESGDQEVIEGYYSPDFSLMSVEIQGRSFDIFALRVLLSQSTRDVSSTPVGEVSSLDGDAYVVDILGEKRTVDVGDDVFFGEEIVLSETSSLSLMMNDESSITLSSGARMVIDSHAFDEGGAEGNESLFSLLKGTFLYLSGKVAQQNYDNVGLVTPVGTIGIRGTSLVAEVKGVGEDQSMGVILLSGAVQFNGGNGSRLLDESFASVQVGKNGVSSSDKADAASLAKQYGKLFSVAGAENLKKIAEELQEQGGESSFVGLLLEEAERAQENVEASRRPSSDSEDEADRGFSSEETEGDPLSGEAVDVSVTPEPAEQPSKVKVFVVRNTPSSNSETLIDLDPPEAPVVGLASDTGVQDGVTSEDRLEFHTEPESTLVLYDESGNEVFREKVGLNGKFAFHLQLDKDGRYTYTVKAIDLADNESEVSTFTFTYDTTAPDAPISVEVEGYGSVYSRTKEKYPEFVLQVAPEEAGHEVLVLRNGEEVGRGEVGSDGGVRVKVKADSGDVAEGLYTYEFLVVDGAGNKGSKALKNVTHDYTPPAQLTAVKIEGYTESVGKRGSFLVNKARPVFNVEGETHAKVEVLVGGKVLGLLSGLTAGVNRLELNAGESLGKEGEDLEVDVTFRLTDRAGNVFDDEYTLRVDRKAPEAPKVTLINLADDLADEDGIVNSARPEFHVKGEKEGGRFLFTLLDSDGNVLIDAESAISPPGENSLAWSPTSALNDLGDVTQNDVEYTLKVKQIDQAGNVSKEETTLKFTVDRKPPDPLVVSFDKDSEETTTGSVTPKIYLSGGVEGDKVRATMEGTSYEGVIGSDGRLELDWNTALSAASGSVTGFTFLVVVTDRAGNQTTYNVNLNVDLEAADVSKSLSFYEVKSSVETQVLDGVYRLEQSDQSLKLKLTVDGGEVGGRVQLIVKKGGVSQVLSIEGGLAGGMKKIVGTSMELDVTLRDGWSAGDYEFSYKIIDKYGNSSPESTSQSLRLDNEAPVKPLVTLETPSIDGFVSTGDVSFDVRFAKLESNGRLTETYSSVQLFLKQKGALDIGILINWKDLAKTTDGDYFVTKFSGGILRGLKDGEYTVAFKVYDKAGHETSAREVSFTVDKTPPPLPVLQLLHSDDTVDNDGVSGSSTPKMRMIIPGGEANPDKVIWEVKDSSGNWRTIKTDNSPKTSIWDAVEGSGFSDGDYKFRVKFVDKAGNESVSEELSVKVDTTAPSAPTLTENNGKTIYAQGAGLDVDVTGLETGASTKVLVSVRLKDGGVVAGWVDKELANGVEFSNPEGTSGKLNAGALWTALQSLVPGQYTVTVTVTQTDKGDNESSSSSWSFNTDTKVPSGTLSQKVASLTGSVFTKSVEIETDGGQEYYKIIVNISGLDVGDKLVLVKGSGSGFWKSFDIEGRLNSDGDYELRLLKSEVDAYYSANSGGQLKLYLQDGAGNRGDSSVTVDVKGPRDGQVSLNFASETASYAEKLTASIGSDVSFVKVVVSVYRGGRGDSTSDASREKVFSAADIKALLDGTKSLGDLLSEVGLSEGAGAIEYRYKISLMGYDRYGNEMASVKSRFIVVDKIKPTVNGLSVKAEDGTSSPGYVKGGKPLVNPDDASNQIALVFNAEAGLTDMEVEYRKVGGTYEKLASGLHPELVSGSTYKLLLSPQLLKQILTDTSVSSGEFEFRVRAKDSVGNLGDWTSSVPLWVDNEAPSLPSVDFSTVEVISKDIGGSTYLYSVSGDKATVAKSDGSTKGRLVINLGDVSDIGSVKVGLFNGSTQEGGDILGSRDGVTSKYSFLLDGVDTEGTYTLKFKVKDAYGNESDWLDSSLNVDVVDGSLISGSDFRTTDSGPDASNKYEITWLWEGASGTLGKVKSIQLFQETSPGNWEASGQAVKPISTTHVFSHKPYVSPGSTVNYKVVVTDYFGRSEEESSTLVSTTIDMNDFGAAVYVKDTGWNTATKKDGVTSSALVYVALPGLSAGRDSDWQSKVSSSEIFLKVTVEYQSPGGVWVERTFYKKVTSDSPSKRIDFDLLGKTDYYLDSGGSRSGVKLKASDLLASGTKFRGLKIKLLDKDGGALNGEKSVDFYASPTLPPSDGSPPPFTAKQDEIVYDNTAPVLAATRLTTDKFSDSNDGSSTANSSASYPSLSFVYTEKSGSETNPDVLIRIPRLIELQTGDRFSDFSYEFTLKHTYKVGSGTVTKSKTFQFEPGTVDSTGTALVFRLSRSELGSDLESTVESTFKWRVSDFKVRDKAGHETSLSSTEFELEATYGATSASPSGGFQSAASEKDFAEGFTSVAVEAKHRPAGLERVNKEYKFDAPVSSTKTEVHHYSHYYETKNATIASSIKESGSKDKFEIQDLHDLFSGDTRSVGGKDVKDNLKAEVTVYTLKDGVYAKQDVDVATRHEIYGIDARNEVLIDINAAMKSADKIFFEVSAYNGSVLKKAEPGKVAAHPYTTPKVLIVVNKDGSYLDGGPAVSPREDSKEDSFVYQDDETGIDESGLSHEDDVSEGGGDEGGDLVFSEDLYGAGSLSDTPDVPTGEAF